MRRTLPVATLLAAAALAACADTPTDARRAPGSAPAAAASENAPIYLVTFNDGVTDVRGAANAIAHGNGLALRHVREHAARGFSAVIPAARLDLVRSDPRVKLVEKDGPVQLIAPVHVQAKPGGGGGVQSTPWGITRVGGAGDGTGKTAWILDTGVDLANADLNTSKACHTYFAGNSPSDGNGHGTHVAGTIAARNNAIDVVGVAAGAYVCSVRVLGNSGSGSWEGIVNGVNFVASRGGNGDVANISLGGSGSNATLENAIRDAAARGIKFVLSAGNSGANTANYTPARLNASNVYTISAIDSNGCMPSWSNWGNPPVDYAAPGVSVVSLRRGGGTTSMSGTSMAAPHVAGILLLGSVRADGSATCDRDGNPDPIAHR
ncbi:MAG TPA: S8 family serine peptidase [Longimicrobium sp.]|nr:S8 family serine peptidase [Longimicrobium sp.]